MNSCDSVCQKSLPDILRVYSLMAPALRNVVRDCTFFPALLLGDDVILVTTSVR